MLFFLASLCAAYLVGAVPTGFLAGRLFKGVDVRQLGSGNLGATNVYRVVGAIPGLLVLIVDVAKGWLPVMFLAPVAAFGPSVKPEGAAILLGMAAVAGHSNRIRFYSGARCANASHVWPIPRVHAHGKVARRLTLPTALLYCTDRVGPCFGDNPKYVILQLVN